jgi:hypothetical protein
MSENPDWIVLNGLKFCHDMLPVRILIQILQNLENVQLWTSTFKSGEIKHPLVNIHKSK